MSDLSVNFLLFKGEKYVQKSLNKIRPQSPMENVSRYLSDYSTIVLAAKMCFNYNEHVMYIRTSMDRSLTDRSTVLALLTNIIRGQEIF